MRPTLYEFAGGEQAFEPFAVALHARCLADPELNHPFSHADQNPEHVPRLAAYLARATDRFLTVPDPRLAVLKEIPRSFLAIRIRLTEPEYGGPPPG